MDHHGVFQLFDVNFLTHRFSKASPVCGWDPWPYSVLMWCKPLPRHPTYLALGHVGWWLKFLGLAQEMVGGVPEIMVDVNMCQVLEISWCRLLDLGVSWKRATAKSFISRWGLSLINHPFWGPSWMETPIFFSPGFLLVVAVAIPPWYSNFKRAEPLPELKYSKYSGWSPASKYLRWSGRGRF